MEYKLATAGKGKASRALLDEAYSSISSAIFDAFNSLTVEAAQTVDEKDNLNAHVMTVQNAHFLLNQLRSIAKNPSVDLITKHAKTAFDENLEGYAALSAPRLLKGLPDFFGAIRKLLDAGPPEEIPFHASLNKSAAKSVTASVTPKDLRKAVEQLYERVIKHFGGGPQESSLMQVVWHAFQEYILGEVAFYNEALIKVYPGTGIQLSFTVDELLSYFNDVNK